MKITRRAALAGLGSVALQSSRAAAQDRSPVQLIVPFAAGGNTDVLARVLAQTMTPDLGRPVIVENRPGAGTMLGSQGVAAAEPDGRTYLFTTSGYAIAQVLQPKLPFDPDKDLIPLAQVASVPMVVAVHPSVPAKTLGELIAHLQANPGKLSFASAGSGSALHMAGELLKYAGKVDIAHVPYRGAGPALTDTISGMVQIIIDGITTTAPHVRSGALRALAVTSTERSPQLPEVPTVVEAGLPGLETQIWNVVMARAGTPDTVMEPFRASLGRALASPDLQARFAELGAQVTRGSTPDQVKALIRREIDKWRPVAAANGLRG
jgi:tripartite-type tricarboxylate transporter receptor subunit TctC